jgi:hypothetical protein
MIKKDRFIKDVHSWLPNHLNYIVDIDIDNAVDDIKAAIAGGWCGGIDPERSFEIAEMYYGFTGLKALNFREIGLMYGHGYTEGWAAKQRTRIIKAYIAYRLEEFTK